MGNSFNSSGDYRIEISGWGLDNSFFAERTDLLWTSDGEKQVQLHRALPEGAMVFIQLVSPESSTGSVPVAYQVKSVVPMDCDGRCRIRLAQMHPRSKNLSAHSSGKTGAASTGESLSGKRASNVAEDSQRVCNARETEQQLQHEEILQ